MSLGSSITRSTTPDTAIQALSSKKHQPFNQCSDISDDAEKFLREVIQENALNIEQLKQCPMLSGFDRLILACHTESQQNVEGENFLPFLYKKIYTLVVEKSPFALKHVPIVLIQQSFNQRFHPVYIEIAKKAFLAEPKAIECLMCYKNIKGYNEIIRKPESTL